MEKERGTQEAQERNAPGVRGEGRLAGAASSEPGEPAGSRQTQEGSRAGNTESEPERDQVKSQLARPLWELLPYEEYEEIPFTD